MPVFENIWSTSSLKRRFFLYIGKSFLYILAKFFSYWWTAKVNQMVAASLFSLASSLKWLEIVSNKVLSDVCLCQFNLVKQLKFSYLYLLKKKFCTDHLQTTIMEQILDFLLWLSFHIVLWDQRHLGRNNSITISVEAPTYNRYCWVLEIILNFAIKLSRILEAQTQTSWAAHQMLLSQNPKPLFWHMSAAHRFLVNSNDHIWECKMLPLVLIGRHLNYIQESSSNTKTVSSLVPTSLKKIERQNPIQECCSTTEAVSAVILMKSKSTWKTQNTQ